MSAHSIDSVLFEFSENMKEVLRVQAGEELEFITCDCFNKQITYPEGKYENIDFTRVNPATGPVYIEGAYPGNLLKIDILNISIDSLGIGVASPKISFLKHPTPVHRTFFISNKNGLCRFGSIEFPVRPMIGVIGVAPDKGTIPTITPGRHGGNLDTQEITTGNTVYLPIFQEGGMLSIGDLHASMGDGEICGTGIEVSGRARVRVNTVLNQFNINTPVIETTKSFLFLYSAETLNDALEQGALECINVLQKSMGLTFEEILVLMSATSDFRISQLVDPLVTIKIILPKTSFRLIS